MTWAIVQATEDHAAELAPRMTPADAAEVWALNHWGPQYALLISLRLSLVARTWMVDGQPACMFGFAVPSMLGETAIPWMLGSDMIAANRFAFLRNYRAEIAAMLSAFPVLETWVHARHKVCLRWLRWTGFEIGPPEPLGIEGDDFCRVTLRRPQWAQ